VCAIVVVIKYTNLIDHVLYVYVSVTQVGIHGAITARVVPRAVGVLRPVSGHATVVVTKHSPEVVAIV